MRRIALLFIAVATAALTAAVPAAAQQVSKVVEARESEIAAGPPGSIIRIWPQVGGSVANAKAFRILYRSTGLNGEPIAVSGAIFIPNGPVPHRRRDVIAWAHPTSGVVDRCAPTLLPNLSGTVAGLEEMIRRGFVVVATDYEGLGVRGMHPYLIGQSEARSVIDSVRAARDLTVAHASNRFAVWGHSQGGHAALFTGEEVGAYAPDLKLVGIAAAAPATDLIALFKADRGSTGGDSLTAMALLSWATVYNIHYDTILLRSARRDFDQVSRACIQTIADLVLLEQLAQPLRHRFLKADPTKIDPWHELMLTNSPGHNPVSVPVFIAQGTADETVHPQITRRFADRLCRQGVPVYLKYLRGVKHMYAGYEGAHDAIDWMADRFRGLRPPSGCRR
jgi:acetyl esterase/lipase